MYALNDSIISMPTPHHNLSGHYRHLVHVQISKKRIIPLTHGKCVEIYHKKKFIH